MVYTKTFANIDDLHLSKKANSAIVLLNTYLPDDYAKYWVMVEEMTERLISCGVNSSLQKIDVTVPHNIITNMACWRSVFTAIQLTFGRASISRDRRMTNGLMVNSPRPIHDYSSSVNFNWIQMLDKHSATCCPSYIPR